MCIRDRTRIQSDGSPIRLDLSGEIALLEMGDWDIEMKEKCEANMVEVDLSDRYVDDVDIVMGAIPHGYRWVKERLEYDEEWELEDENIPLDQHTITIMEDISNSIRKSIQMEGDYGSKHTDGCIPVLDLKMRTVLITEKEDKERGMPAISYYQTSFKFYKKPMARPTVMHASSAMPAKIKRETTSNELLRRLLNTS